MTLRLMYVSHSTEDGEDESLFVWAETLDEAIVLWATYYEMYGGTDDNWHAPKPTRVFVVPHEPPAEAVAIGWELEELCHV